jgi:hypothetical protein
MMIQVRRKVKILKILFLDNVSQDKIEELSTNFVKPS